MIITARSRSHGKTSIEAEVAEASRLSRMAEATAQIGHWRIGAADDRVLFWSDEVYRIHGLDPAIDTPTRERARAVYHPDDRKRVDSAVRAAIDTAEPLDLRARILHPNGEVRHVLVRGCRDTSADGGHALFGVIMDVTEQVFAEARLNDSAERLKYALEAGRMYAWECDLTSTAVTRSGDFHALLGSFEGDIADFEKRIHPEDREAVRTAVATAVADGAPYEAVFRFERPCGSIVWLRDVGRVVEGDGRARLMGLCWDVTALKIAEDALREREERLALALESTNDGLWDWFIDTGVSWYSDRWFTMLGYEPNEFPGHASTWERLVHPDDLPEVMRQTIDHFECRSEAYECEFRLRTKDGGWAWVLSRGKVVKRDESGRPLRIVGTHIDIAARKAAEQQVAHLVRHDPPHRPGQPCLLPRAP